MNLSDILDDRHVRGRLERYGLMPVLTRLMAELIDLAMAGRATIRHTHSYYNSFQFQIDEHGPTYLIRWRRDLDKRHLIFLEYQGANHWISDALASEDDVKSWFTEHVYRENAA